jgi:hypothetical protein
VAAFYYVMALRTQQDNMRETVKNRKATLTNNLMQFMTSYERQKINTELMSMEWKDFDDFYNKYDSKRISIWDYYELLGVQYRAGLLDFETIYAVAVQVINLWIRFKPIIEEYRKFDYGKDLLSNWEYLANELARVRAERDPSFKGSRSYFKANEYDETFKK